MRRADSPEEGDAARSPPSLLFLSFFEQECRDIVARLLHPAEPSPLPPDRSALRLESAGFVTSTPLSDSAPGNDVAPDSAPAAGACPRSPGPEAAAAPTPARGEPQCLPQRAAGSRPARPQALPRRTAQRGAAQQLYGRQGPQTRTSGRGGRQSLSQAWASPGLELPRAGKGLGAPGSRLLQPAGAARAGALRQPARRLSTAVRALASRSRLQPLGKEPSPKRFRGSTVKEQLCNMTQELMKNDESKEWLVGTAVGADKADQTWVYRESSLCSEMLLGPTPGCEDAVTAEQSAGDRLSQELKHVKTDSTALCEAYRQTICSLQARIRAARICLEDAEVEKSGDRGRASQQHMGAEPQQPLVCPPELLDSDNVKLLD
ncbi:uncharacterized protein AAGF69_007537 isoform 2-T2 [Amazona ochrocephala]